MAILLDSTVAGVEPKTLDKVRRGISRTFWTWYAEHAEDVIISRKVAFWTIKVRVRDLHRLFVELFGAEDA